MSVPTNHDQRRVAVVTTTIRIPHALLGNMDQFCRLDRPAPLVAVGGDRRTPPSIRRWRMEGTGLNRAQAARLPLYERTRQFRAGCWVLPGLIQTEAYTRAVLRAAHSHADVVSFFAGLELVGPGITEAQTWRAWMPEPVLRRREGHVLAGVGRVIAPDVQGADRESR